MLQIGTGVIIGRDRDGIVLTVIATRATTGLGDRGPSGVMVLLIFLMVLNREAMMVKAHARMTLPHPMRQAMRV